MRLPAVAQCQIDAILRGSNLGDLVTFDQLEELGEGDLRRLMPRTEHVDARADCEGEHDPGRNEEPFASKQRWHHKMFRSTKDCASGNPDLNVPSRPTDLPPGKFLRRRLLGEKRT